MKTTCPHCGAPLHESKKRAYQCGTWENSEGTEYRTVPCKMSETRWKDAKHWASVAEEADRQRAVALSWKDQAEAEAKKDREFAQHWHIRLQEETDKLRAEYLQKVKTALGIEDPIPEEETKTYDVYVSGPDLHYASRIRCKASERGIKHVEILEGTAHKSSTIIKFTEVKEEA